MDFSTEAESKIWPQYDKIDAALERKDYFTAYKILFKIGRDITKLKKKYKLNGAFV